MSYSTEQITEFFSLLLALFAVLAALFKASVLFSNWYRGWLRRRKIKGLVLEPTPEELAKYSKGIPSQPTKEEREHERKVRKEFSFRAELQRQEMEGRITLLIIFFIMCFVALVLRFALIGFL